MVKSVAGSNPWKNLDGLQSVFCEARDVMIENLIERNEEVDIVLTALLCNEHSLLIGPPGVAKSMLVDAIADLIEIDDSHKFNILFSKYTTPEEVFGPMDINKMTDLKNPQFFRHPKNMLPEAFLAICDEIFNASSAISNTMLKIMNEGTYRNGDGIKVKCPLLTMMGASNRYPNDEDGKEMNAFVDRFLFRKTVRSIQSQGGLVKLLGIPVQGMKTVPRRDHKPVFSEHLTLNMVRDAQALVKMYVFTKEANDAFMSILAALAKEGIHPGDRRKYKAVEAVMAYAFLMKASKVDTEHLEILSHILWDDPEHDKKTSEVIVKIANPIGMTITGILIQAEDVYQSHTNPIEATNKLKDLQKQLTALKNDPRKNAALASVKRMTADITKKAIGVDDEDDALGAALADFRSESSVDLSEDDSPEDE